jgi:guanine nucleotide-binding protein subunit beta-2-like 1 protein
VSPDGSLAASGDVQGKIMLWDLNEGRHLCSFEASGPIHALTFSPCYYWLCACAGDAILIWDLENKTLLTSLFAPNHGECIHRVPVQAISMCWSVEGQRLFAGYTDGVIRLWDVTMNAIPTQEPAIPESSAEWTAAPQSTEWSSEVAPTTQADWSDTNNATAW